MWRLITPPMKPKGKEMREERRMVPSLGCSRPAIMLMIVVLPAPFEARMPRELPSSTRNVA